MRTIVWSGTSTCQWEHISTVWWPVGWFSWATMPNAQVVATGASGVSRAGIDGGVLERAVLVWRKASLSLRPGFNTRASFHRPSAKALRKACAVATARALGSLPRVVEGATVLGEAAVVLVPADGAVVALAAVVESVDAPGASAVALLVTGPAVALESAGPTVAFVAVGTSPRGGRGAGRALRLRVVAPTAKDEGAECDGEDDHRQSADGDQDPSEPLVLGRPLELRLGVVLVPLRRVGRREAVGHRGRGHRMTLASPRPLPAAYCPVAADDQHRARLRP